jgi:hypothetical protein
VAHIITDGRTGWSCPSCGRCYSPDVFMCATCPPPAPADGVSAPFSAVEPILVDGEEREEPIFVPTREGVTPAQMADAQHLLRYTARHIVKGEFVVLPPGAKILPAGPGACPR